jgi:Methyltransferase domain
MDIAAIKDERERIVEQYGGWTDHNVVLADDVYTMDERRVSEKLRRIVQVVSDVAGTPLRNLRILDLACLEGGYAIEFARQGAKAVGIEGREASIMKARFVKRVLGLNNLEFFQDDIRNLSKERYGEFDVVLCLGVFYHLNAPHVFRLAEQIADVCTRFAVFDTHFSVVRDRSYQYRDQQYWGRDVVEHDPETSQEERLEDLWASLDNVTAVWPTMNSLVNMLSSAGFTSVYQCHAPVELNKPADRVTLVAAKGTRPTILSTPLLNEMPVPQLPEKFNPSLSPPQRRFYQVSRRLHHLLPLKFRRAVKSALRSVGLWGKELEPWERDWKHRHVDR